MNNLIHLLPPAAIHLEKKNNLQFPKQRSHIIIFNNIHIIFLQGLNVFPW